MGKGEVNFGGEGVPTILLEIGHAHLPPPPKSEHRSLGAPTSGSKTAPNLKPPISERERISPSIFPLLLTSSGENI